MPGILSQNCHKLFPPQTTTLSLHNPTQFPPIPPIHSVFQTFHLHRRTHANTMAADDDAESLSDTFGFFGIKLQTEEDQLEFEVLQKSYNLDAEQLLDHWMAYTQNNERLKNDFSKGNIKRFKELHLSKKVERVGGKQGLDESIPSVPFSTPKKVKLEPGE